MLSACTPDRQAELTMKRQPWFERVFPTGLPSEQLPLIIERLRGTPARLEDRLKRVADEALTRRRGDTWSAQENAGHLLDMEGLWLTRVGDLADGRPELAA